MTFSTLRISRRILASLAAALAMGATAVPAEASSPAGAVTVNPSDPGTLGDLVYPLAGSASWLVYQRSVQVIPHAEPIGAGAPMFSDFAPSRVVRARSASGRTVTVTTRDSDTGWSIATDVLTALRPWGGRDRFDRVDWWKVRSGAHGTVRLAPGASYLTSAPGGFFFVSAHGNLDRRHVSSGRVRSYGTFAKPFAEAVAGPRGMLITPPGGYVTGKKYFRYVRYARPRHSVRLQIPGTPGDPTLCTAVSATDAACYRISDDDDDAAPYEDVVAPLDGAARTVSKTCPGVPSVAGHTMVWGSSYPGYGPDDGCSNQSPTLVSITEGDRKAERSSTPVGSLLTTSAYGKAMFTGAAGDAVIGATSARQSAVLFRSAASRDTVGAFALSAGRLTDTDDQPDARHPSHLVSVRSRSLATTGGVALGPSSVVGAGIDDQSVDGTEVAASGTATAYIVAARSDGEGRLRVVSPSGVVTIDSVDASGTDPSTVTLSGNRVLYQLVRTDGHREWTLRDLRTGTTRDIGSTTAMRSVGLWGNYLVYQSGRTVYREDLTTGTKTVVTTLAKHVIASGLAEYGDHVLVWLGITSDVYDVSGHTVTHLHTGAPRSPVQATPAISAAGVVFLNRNEFRLRPWSGRSVKLRSYSQVLAGTRPQVDGQALGWLTAGSNLKVARLDVPVARPRFLGAPIAPATFTAGSSAWTTSIPYSTPLTTCSVTISRGSTEVRQLPCDSAQAGLGVAAVAWDGTDASGTPVPPADYQWRVSAAGESGAALDYDGGAADVQGTVTVTD